MASFGTMQSRVNLLTGGYVSLADAGTLVNRVDQEECQDHFWHRLRGMTEINAVAPYGTGTVAVVTGATAVTGTGTVWTAAMTGYQIRLNNDDALYTFTETSPTAGTLDQPWPQPTLTTGSYSLFPLTYALPAGAQRVLDVRRTADLVETTQEAVDRGDPARRSTANPSTRWAPAGRDSTDHYLIELWPHPSAAVGYNVRYMLDHVDLVAAGDLPRAPGPVVENKALHDATLMMFSRTGDARWDRLADKFWGRYQTELQKALEQDLLSFGVQGQVMDVAGGARIGMDLLFNHDYEAL